MKYIDLISEALRQVPDIRTQYKESIISGTIRYYIHADEDAIKAAAEVYRKGLE